MKPLSYSLIAAALACGLASAQTTAYTTPVGYVSLGNTAAATDNVAADTDVYLSLPLLKTAVYQGAVSSVSGSDLTLSGTPALGDLLTNPHIIQVENGPKSGLIGLITAVAGSVLTIETQTGDSISGITGSVSIRPAWTLADLSTQNVLPNLTQVLGFTQSSNDQNPAADLGFEYFGGSWSDIFGTSGAPDPNKVVLYPGEAFILRTPPASGIADLMLSGEVPTANQRVIVQNDYAGVGEDNLVGFKSPVPELLADCGLGFTAGDQLIGFVNADAGINKAGVYAFEWSGTAWTDIFGTWGDPATFELTPGEGYVYRRSYAAPAGDVVWTDEQTYIPSL
jgi:uncharacterized protein (TIGR02597 family)